MNLKKFDVDKANEITKKANKERKISEENYNKELSKILNEIYRKAKRGVSYLRVKGDLSAVTIETLRLKCFNIERISTNPNIYEINW